MKVTLNSEHAETTEAAIQEFRKTALLMESLLQLGFDVTVTGTINVTARYKVPEPETKTEEVSHD